METGIKVRVQPRASRDEVLGFQGEVLRVRVTAPPHEGRANQALVEVLSQALDVPRSRIRILRGHGSRDKLLAVEGLSREDVEGRLAGAPG